MRVCRNPEKEVPLEVSICDMLTDSFVFFFVYVGVIGHALLCRTRYTIKINVVGYRRGGRVL